MTLDDSYINNNNLQLDLFSLLPKMIFSYVIACFQMVYYDYEFSESLLNLKDAEWKSCIL
jgi:hypothetical protein